VLWSPGLSNSYHAAKKWSEGIDYYEMGWGMASIL
jgi:hypothetical protein